jgi:long-chain acyl-CoA synthetase
LSRAFRSAGLSEGDVAIVSPNCAEYLIVYFAATRAALSVVPVNWHLSEPELRFLLDDSFAKAIVVHERLGLRRLERIRELNSQGALLLAIGSASGYVSLEVFVVSEPNAPLDLPVWGRRMAYTSATTGRPTAVILPARNAKSALESGVDAMRLLGVLPEDGHVRLCASMLYHAASLGGCELGLTMGHRLVLVDQWQPELLLQLVERHRVTMRRYPGTVGRPLPGSAIKTLDENGV